MLKLEAVAAFVAVAEAGSISAAGRRLELSKSVISQRLGDLERMLGATLLHRTTRKIAITQDGSAFLERARRILREVADATAELGERRGGLVGPLRVAAPVSFGVLHLGPALNAFLARHPGIELTLDLDDRLVDMVAGGYDAVVRHGAVADEQVIVKRLALSRRCLVAAPAYLEKCGTPRTLDELEGHRGIVYSNRGAGDWRFKAARDHVTVRPATVVMRVNNGLLMRDAAVAGLGVALLPTYFIRAELARKRLVVVDVGAEPEGATLYLAFPHDRRGSAKLRALIEWLRAAFGSPPYWDR
jgi:DNA-binding transcriptional LysR family regulator